MEWIIFEIKLQSWNLILVRMNLIIFIIFLFIVFIISSILKKSIKVMREHSIMINEVNLGIGNSRIKVSYNKKDQEIAYKLWVELSTRKIGIVFDEENSV